MASSRFDDVRWQARLEELHVFVGEYQRWPNQNAVALVERRVAFWVSAQRKAYRRGAMPADRIVRLESVPGWSSTCCPAGNGSPTLPTPYGVSNTPRSPHGSPHTEPTRATNPSTHTSDNDHPA